MTWIKLGEEQLKKQPWNLKEELETADYRIKKEPAHRHTCPYCSVLNRGHKYYPKMQFTKCEACGKVFKNHYHKRC